MGPALRVRTCGWQLCISQTAGAWRDQGKYPRQEPVKTRRAPDPGEKRKEALWRTGVADRSLRRGSGKSPVS
ncbi:hypothetical protein NDU88_003551 [Pleurodeles waltl]|uniref:Uncharacterized protein n=1 Tax=Pleurodeles waltl TaxID=8319 RepID=A0AAV7LIV4_PLEWA|nr:hypothetical protein NDU88_003551 [Pleurodeles waltl]